jgi:hypothetical protein
MNTAILEVVIGLAFLYALLSLIVTTIQESLATLLQSRAKTLFESVAGMIGSNYVEKVFDHPLIRNLSNKGRGFGGVKPKLFGNGLPSYIPSRTFVIAFLDVVRREKPLAEAVGITGLLSKADELVKDVKDPELRVTLELLLADTAALGDRLDRRAELASQRLETWFNERMERTSGWYKRKSQLWAFLIAGAVVAVTNADSIHVAQRLWSDNALRASVVAAAESYQRDNSAPEATSQTPSAALASLRTELKESSLPLGWTWQGGALCARTKSPTDPSCWSPSKFDLLTLVLGWVATALALSLGSNYWFDMLSRALNLRGGGQRIATTPATASASPGPSFTFASSPAETRETVRRERDRSGVQTVQTRPANDGPPADEFEEAGDGQGR